MAPHIKALMYISIGLGTTITFSSWHWLFTWIGLEINTLAIIPLMAQKNHPRGTEAATKYFLIQSAATGVFLFAMILNAHLVPEWTVKLIEHPIACVLMVVALTMKLGLAPFHYWLPEVMQGLDLTTGLILSTWQKMAPFAVLLQINYTPFPELLVLIGVVSIVAGLAGLNQTEVRKILAYSSTTHMGWIFLIIICSPNLAILSFGIYVFMVSAVFLTLKETSSTKINTLSLSWSKKPILAVILLLTLLSLGGLPPLTGFMPKWLILNEMVAQALTFPAVVATAGTLANLFFYLRLCYTTTIVYFTVGLMIKLPWRSLIKQPAIPSAIVSSAALILLPLTPLVWALSLLIY
uniref:NADH-ubiquinone oxidoreductase chain 2 n=2 Tax=Deuterodon TaxID=930316 RepID=A0A5A4MLD1_9TELE|nr:NADH dehydrogenase subunit 2 [Deuterodon giton]AXY96061.1 NADH dehydrogenase subunit 2 [Deuterodon giton]